MPNKVNAAQLAARHKAAIVICVLLAVCLGSGFAVSWDALRGAALAAHASDWAASLYAICVDGVIAIALASGIILRDHEDDRRYSLVVLAVFSTSSLALNVAHGQGAFVEGATYKGWWFALLLGLTSAQPVAAIGFGSHLLVKALRVLFPNLGEKATALVPAPRPAAETEPESAGKPKPKPKAKPKVAPARDRSDEDLLVEAREANRLHHEQYGQPISLNRLRPALRIGRGKATDIHRLLMEEVA